MTLARHGPRGLPRLLAGYAGGLALLTAAGLDAPLLAVAAWARARPVRY